MIRALQRKFVLVAMSAITGLLLVLLGTINWANMLMAGSQADHTLEMLSEYEGDVANLPPPPFQRPGPPVDGPKNDYDIFLSSNYFVVRLDRKGNIAFVDVSRTSAVGEEEAGEMARQAVNQGAQKGEAGRFRYLLRHFPEPGGTLAVFLDTSQEISSYIQVLLLSIGIGLGCWGLMLGAVIFMSRRAIRPIAENIQRQKQFVTNAGHELKTPLAIIQSNVEAMELYQEENKWSRNIKTQILRLTGLVEDLLLLARMEERAEQRAREKLCLDKLTAEVLESFAPPAEEKGISLKISLRPNTLAEGDRAQVVQLLTILVDNGIKYADKGGVLEVTLEKAGGHGELRLENTCHSLPQVSPDKLFQRFYREDSARTQKSGGYGIGLSVAQALAEANQIKLSAQYIQPNRVRLLLRF